MIILGADPGLHGAIAIFNTETGDMAIDDMPIFSLKRGGKTKNELDPSSLARIIDPWSARIQCAFVEQVGAMPSEGVSSVFSFGKSYGILIGILAAKFIPVTFVAPIVWKKAMKVSASKDGARARASQVFPRHSGLWTRVKDDGRAESALIAAWGAHVLATESLT